MPAEHIPPKVINHVLQRLAVEFADRDAALGEAVSALVAQAGARGALQSSGAILGVVKLYAAEARLRTQQARLCLQQAMASLGGSQHEGFADAALVFLRPIIADQAAKLRAAMLAQPPLRQPTPRRPEDDRLIAMLDEAFRTADTVLRLDLVETEGAARHVSKQPDGNNTANVTGDGNIVLVGIANSDVSIRLDGAARDAITAAMTAVLEGLGKSGLPADKASEVRELAEECAALATQEKPNKTKLGASLKAISESIRTIGAMQSAAQAVRTALTYLGLSGGI